MELGFKSKAFSPRKQTIPDGNIKFFGIKGKQEENFTDVQICVQTLATNFSATLRDTFQFYVTVADWGPLLMSGAILMSSLHLFESPNH